MEDLMKLDDEIVKAAEVVGLWSADKDSTDSIVRLHPIMQRLAKAVAAKREASRPKLLSAEEAWGIYADKGGWNPDNRGMQAVLDADRASILKVIEGLPTLHVGSLHRVECRSLSDIRSALSTREG